MNILMTSHYTLPHRGGIEIIIEKLSLALAKEGNDVRVVSSRIPGQEHYNRPSRTLIGIPAFDPFKNWGVHYPLFAPSLLSVLYRSVRWADVVHVQGMLYLNSVFALLLARALHRPAILTEHAGFVPYERALFNTVQKIATATIGRLSLALSDIIVVPDTIVQEILVRRFLVPSAKIVRIPLGVDTSLFHPLTPNEKERLRRALGWDTRPKVLFIGNLVARKRVHLLLDALSERFDVVLCGEGYPKTFSTKQVLLYPPAKHEELVKLYQAADLFVVPSKVETFSIVSYEAMACGLPVIMTEDLHHLTIAQSGLVTFVPATAVHLREAIHDFLDHPHQRTNIGQNSARWVREHFSWQATVAQHADLYRTLLTTPQRK
ncbi:MAG: glycosyltransferase family 1 protein [Anaerolineae bacterium]|nr:MAG: glycosyltransferase family 1 protein [Anaerolineae bacterium]